MADPGVHSEETNALVRLMTADYDPGGLTDDELVAAARDARETKKRAELAVAVELMYRGWSWRAIGSALLVDHSTAYGWVRDAGLLPDKETLRAIARKDGPVPDPATRPEHPPVVAAIVTSHRGVLAGRRNDNKPPWTFIAGEIEPGESQVDAAIREVKEETGLEVRAGHHELGRRVHPKTGRTMVYLACSPVDSPDGIFVGDQEELAEVRWLSLADVDELMPGVFKPVRDYLGRAIS